MKRLAIVGGGITGATCAYKLQNEYQITLFEKENALGGQARTHNVNGINVEAAVSVVGKLTYVEFFKLMEEIGFTQFSSYSLTGLHVHDKGDTKLYIDVNGKRLLKIFPRFVKENPKDLFKTFLLAPFLYRLYFDYRRGKLDGVTIMESYQLYPKYSHLITTVLSILSLITAVGVKNVSIAHVLNFIFDFENNDKYQDPFAQVLNTFIQTQIPDEGVSAYFRTLEKATKADIKLNSGIKKLNTNEDHSISIIDNEDAVYTFDKVIIACQPFQVSKFLDYRNEKERQVFERLNELVTRSMVTNHQDNGVLDGLKHDEGLVDFRLDFHDDVAQTTITRDQHYYTAQTLPEDFDFTQIRNKEYVDTRQSPDNYSIDKNKILSQHFHAVQHMTDETAELFRAVLKLSGEDNLHFACAALSNYPTSQEGGVRSALRVIEEITT